MQDAAAGPLEESSEPKKSPVTVLIAEDEEAAQRVCREIVHSLGQEAFTASTTEEALDVLEKHPVEVILLDLKMPTTGGMDLLEQVKRTRPNVECIVLTAHGTIETAVQAMKLGAYDYVTKPFHVAELKLKLERLIERLNMDAEIRVLKEQLRTHPGFGGLVGRSPKMQKIYKMMLRVGQGLSPVLILGESGTGKELVARSIHFFGPRRNAPFVPVDCSSLVPTLIESELFGYVKGAFTGANRTKQGLLEVAIGGTIFLDEIAELSVDLQAKLLRALQEKEVKPVGGTHRTPIDVRVIAATNRELEQAVRNGTFRQDLYFRLNVVAIRLPPLRERKTDIPLLVHHFIEKFSDTNPRMRGISEEALSRLMAYDWPGNVREVENVVERAMALGSGPLIQLADLPSNLQFTTGERISLTDELLPLAELEKRAILRAVRESGGDKVAAARLLGIGKTTLYRKLKQYQLERSQSL
jgi:two-component system response regulator HydG